MRADEGIASVVQLPHRFAGVCLAAPPVRQTKTSDKTCTPVWDRLAQADDMPRALQAPAADETDPGAASVSGILALPGPRPVFLEDNVHDPTGAPNTPVASDGRCGAFGRQGGGGDDVSGFARDFSHAFDLCGGAYGACEGRASGVRPGGGGRRPAIRPRG